MNPDTSEASVDTGRTASGYELVPRVWEWLFLGWIAFIPVMVGFNLRFLHRYSLPFADLLFVGALAAFLIALLFGARRLRPCTWYRPLLVYAGALILSTLASQNIRQSAPKLAGDLYLIVAAALTVNYVTNLRTLQRAVFAWLAGCVLNISGVAAGLILFFSGVTTVRKNRFLSPFGTLPPGHYPRIRGLFLNPNMMCSYMVAGIMILIAARQAGWISRVTFRLLLSGSIVAAAFSISPGLGGLCLVLGIWQATLQPVRPRARVIAAVGVAIALVVFVGEPISMTPLTKTSLAETVLHPEPSGRLLTWTGALRTFRAHPLFGQGLESEAAHVRYLTASGELQSLTDAHNTWLSVMAQQGLAGLVAFSWVVLHLLRRVRLSRLPGDRLAAFRTSLDLALIGGFLYSTLSGSYENTRHVWALMGLVAAVQELPVTPPILTAD